LHGKNDRSLAERVRQDMAAVSPETTVNLHPVEFGDPWDFEQVYEALFSFARGYPFDADAEDYPEPPIHHLPSDELQDFAYRKTDDFSTLSNRETSIRAH
jgi:sigma54-dependent transcription regulator